MSAHSQPDVAADAARFRALVAALERTIRAPDAGAAVEADARGWLAAQGLSGADVEALARYPARRLLVHRKLVHAGFSSAARVQMPRTVQRLGDRWGAEVARFCASSFSRSHYLRDLPREMVDALAPGWEADPTLPPFLGDLARHELSIFEVAAAPPRASPSAPGAGEAAEQELDLARGVLFDPSARLLAYGFPVHRLHDGQDELPHEACRLFAYRDVEHEVRYLELTPFAAALLERLLRGEPLAESVRAACADVGAPVDEASLVRASRLLADVAERGALIGAAPP